VDAAVPTAELVRRLRAGDPAAASAFFDRYAARLTRLAGEHLGRKLAARVDGEDVVQSVFRTFFRRCAAGEFRIDSSTQVWQLLVAITLRRARSEGRHQTAGRRDVSAEAAADAAGVAADYEPGPEEAAVLADEVEALLRGLPELYCHVLDLRLQGHAVADIAPRLGVSRQTVYRALDLLQRRLARRDADPLA
jgi:RNA polymerase sigma-70 factor (ECF subfamily)